MQSAVRIAPEYELAGDPGAATVNLEGLHPTRLRRVPAAPLAPGIVRMAASKATRSQARPHTSDSWRRCDNDAEN